MSMRTWAEKEVEIAIKREREASGTKGDWNYGAACYESALKAYHSLMGDVYSGCGIGRTKQVLNRLIDGKPLTPIEDTPDVWNDISDISETGEGEKYYQCKRMGSLFKYAYADGTVKYWDINSSYCIDMNNPDCSYNCGLVQEIIDEMFPVKMPYYPPGKAIAVYCEDFLTDKKNDDLDTRYTRCVFYAIKPGGDRVDINRFFKASECEGGWEEISRAEYVKRKLASIDRK